ncbi:hypothetical protein SK128_021581, partial [Halocaridina rubra]
DDKLKTPPVSDEDDYEVEIGPSFPHDTTGETTSGDIHLDRNKSVTREWDLGKVGVGRASTARGIAAESSAGVLSQKEWLECQRIRRNVEFAPPMVYHHGKHS